MPDLKANTLEHTWAVNQADTVVVLSYQSFCDPCGATKPHLEALAKERNFKLVCVNCDKTVSPEHAGRLIPSLSVYRGGVLASVSLRGAQTRQRLLRFLAENKVIA